MSKYAEKTNVTSDRSRAEIEKTLARYGADSFAYATDRSKAAIGFSAFQRRVRFVLPLPDPYAREFTHTPNRGTERSESQRAAAFDQAVRQKWRALALAIKAKLEAVESGIAEFDEEFLAHIVMPDNKTVGEHTVPKITAAYETGKAPPLLPHFD